MAASFNVMFDFGGSDNTPGTEQNTDGLGPPNIRFKQADNATIDANNIIPIPTTGTEYSRWKQIYLECTVAPATQVDNVKFYTDGTGFGTGIVLKVGDQFPTKNSGSDAGYDVSDTNEIITNHTDISSATDAFTFNSGSMLTGPSISEASNIIDATGETTDYLVFSMEVGTTASPGNLDNETLTIQYDEI